MACAQGHESIVTALLAAGAAPSRPALLDACRAKHAAIVAALVQASESLPSGPLRLGTCEEVVELLCVAAHANDLAALAMLLSAGADANGCDYDKRTPLHIAAADGHLKGVRLLVEVGGADASAQDRWGAGRAQSTTGWQPLLEWDHAETVGGSARVQVGQQPAVRGAAHRRRQRGGFLEERRQVDRFDPPAALPGSNSRLGACWAARGMWQRGGRSLQVGQLLLAAGMRLSNLCALAKHLTAKVAACQTWGISVVMGLQPPDCGSLSAGGKSIGSCTNQTGARVACLKDATAA